MPALTPNQLSAASACWNCFDLSISDQLMNRLIAVWSGGSTNPATLATLSAPFQGFSDGAAKAVMAFMLATIAGGSLDRNVLAADAKCFDCFSEGQHSGAQNYLLAQITGSGTDVSALVAQSRAFQGVSDLTAMMLYSLSLKSGVGVAALPAAAKCFACAIGELNSIITLLLANIAGGVLP